MHPLSFLYAVHCLSNGIWTIRHIHPNYTTMLVHHTHAVYKVFFFSSHSFTPVSGPPPQMAVVCQKAWSLGFFNISVSLAILNSTKSVLESIAGFTITSDLIQARNSNFVPLVVERYGYVNLQTQVKLSCI